ncbi:MAG: hypothetical protein IPK14_01500 [Blastocatellia bacterium]|nr:hypothetical protein [Blastocatellia bacterium]
MACTNFFLFSALLGFFSYSFSKLTSSAGFSGSGTLVFAPAAGAAAVVSPPDVGELPYVPPDVVLAGFTSQELIFSFSFTGLG